MCVSYAAVHRHRHSSTHHELHLGVLVVANVRCSCTQEPYTGVSIHFYNFTCSGAEQALWDCPGYSETKAPYNVLAATLGEGLDWVNFHLTDVAIACKAPSNGAKVVDEYGRAATD
jgi:hypothetical protein